MTDTNPATAVVVADDKSSEKTWLTAFFIFALIAVTSAGYLVHALIKTADYLAHVNRVEVAATNIVKDVNDATFSRDFSVSTSAYDRLQADIQSYESSLNNAYEISMGKDAEIIDGLRKEWQTKKEKASLIFSGKNDIDRLQDLREQVVDAAARLQQEYSTLAGQAINARLSANAIQDMQSQVLRAERMANEMSAFTSSTTVSSDEFQKQAEAFASVLNMQVETFGSTLPALAIIQQTYQQYIGSVVGELQTLSDPAIQMRESAQTLADVATTTRNELLKLNHGIVTRPEVVLPSLTLLIAVIVAAFSYARYLSAARARKRQEYNRRRLSERQEQEIEQEKARKIQQENERNQMAILRLLDELGDLAEGDLTVNATVSEDFTGAIADSVNFAIDQMRQVVSAINITADRVAESTRQTQKTASDLREASEHQAKEIAGVSAAISAMAVSIDQVSENAAESAAVAERSVEIAHNGAEVVNRSIEGMNIIRNQIQETSKRIKRLGESSQEIGDIVNLINDIADQTNILALNAAIQASMAGEAGRGFAVVADEVQRLAERSANATRQIEVLVKTIQADTNEAVSSMESTTAEVVKGTKLAQDAGEALEEVQGVSHTLADLIQSISNAAQQQAVSAGHISGIMNVIQDITSQTSSGTLETARSVSRLNEMASALQESVSGFKLSNDDAFVDDVFLDENEFRLS